MRENINQIFSLLILYLSWSTLAPPTAKSNFEKQIRDWTLSIKLLDYSLVKHELGLLGCLSIICVEVPRLLIRSKTQGQYWLWILHTVYTIYIYTKCIINVKMLSFLEWISIFSLRSCSRYVETNGGGSVPLRCGRLEGCSSSTGETPLPAGQRNTAAHESSRDVSQPKERPYQREGLRAIRL